MMVSKDKIAFTLSLHALLIPSPSQLQMTKKSMLDPNLARKKASPRMSSLVGEDLILMPKPRPKPGSKVLKAQPPSRATPTSGVPKTISLKRMSTAIMAI